MEKKLLAPVLDRFAGEMRVRNWSGGTIEQYLKSLADFERFIVERYSRVASVAGITDEMVSAYQLWLCQRENKKRGGPLSPSTQRVYLNAVRSFFSFCTTERIVLLDPARNVELPRVGRRLPRGVLSPKEMRAVLRAPDLSTYTGLRDRAILETFYSTGIRHMELLRLRVCDVDLDRGYVTVLQGKFKKDRVVPLGKVAAHFIREYLTKARPHMLREADTPETRLFLSINGTPLVVRRDVLLDARAADRRRADRTAQRRGASARNAARDHVCVSLSRADLRVPQELLHLEDVARDRVGGDAVAEIIDEECACFATPARSIYWRTVPACAS
jgi:integrase/recombinase XerD